MYTLICAFHSYCILHNSYHIATGLTILGPLFSLLYINDLPYKINNTSKSILFVNNTSIIFSNSDSTDYVTEFDIAINSLSINLNKTNYVHFTAKPNTKIHINTNFEDIQINNFNSKKFLGLTTDNTLIMEETNLITSL